MKFDFEQYIPDKLLERGYEYYLHGAVKNVTIEEDEITATVVGTHNYDVVVEIIDGDIEDTFCTCPYYDEHSTCKHIAALLYYIKDNRNKKNEATEKSISQILDQISKNELKKFLSNLLEQDEDIYDKFRKHFVDYFPTLSISEYRRKISRAIYDISDDDGYIGYRESWDYANAMHEFIEEASRFVEEKHYGLAFDIVTCILDEIPDLEIDDSDGSTGEVGESCIEVIYDIFDSCSKQSYKDSVIKEIFDYVIHEIATNDLGNYGIEVRQIIKVFIKEKLFCEQCEKTLLHVINHLDKEKWHSKYRRQIYVEYLIDLYDIIDNKTKKMTLIKDNLDILDIFKRYIEIMKQEKTIQELITLLIDYRCQYQEYFEYISNTLLEIYEFNHMEAEYKEELHNTFFLYQKYNFKIYQKIKSLYHKKDWEQERKKIISKIDNNSIKAFQCLSDIYIEENLIDELFILVKNSSFETLKHYEQYILPKYNKELIELYINHCKRQLALASDRKAYAQLANNLKYIKQLPHSAFEVTKFISMIQKEYAKRPALLDEISKV